MKSDLLSSHRVGAGTAAARFVGRVGALAVALGVGATVGAIPSAFGDDRGSGASSSADSPTSDSSTADGPPARAPRRGGSRASTDSQTRSGPTIGAGRSAGQGTSAFTPNVPHGADNSRGRDGAASAVVGDDSAAGTSPISTSAKGSGIAGSFVGVESPLDAGSATTGLQQVGSARPLPTAIASLFGHEPSMKTPTSSMPVIVAAGAFSLICYLVGRTDYSHYLGIPYVPGAGELAIFCAAIMGAGLAFLWFNAPPAAVFMGDTGSLALGGSLGAIAVASHHEIVLGLVGGLFVLEAASVIIQVFFFKRTGRRVFRMAPIHHHFEQLGWPESTVVIRFWIVSIVLALLGLATLKLR